MKNSAIMYDSGVNILELTTSAAPVREWKLVTSEGKLVASLKCSISFTLFHSLETSKSVKALYVSHSFTEEPYRRQGYAASLYQGVASLLATENLGLVSSGVQSCAAESLWNFFMNSPVHRVERVLSGRAIRWRLLPPE